MRITLDTRDSGNVTAFVALKGIKRIEAEPIERLDSDDGGPDEYHRTIRIVTSDDEVLELKKRQRRDRPLDWLTPKPGKKTTV